MYKTEFEAILLLKIEDFISFLIENKGMSFDKAVQCLYQSKVYEALSDEETKLWHLSTPALYEMLEIEKKEGKIIYPDFV